MKKVVKILQLYPRDMNMYGDWGNVLAIKKRLEWRGFRAEVIDYNPGDTFPDEIDIVVGGGGQDSGQNKIKDDLQKIAPKLKYLAENNTPMLMICGMYQLFGHRFITSNGDEIPGIGILDIETRASNQRLIGNIVTESDEFGEIVGYENHSGQTFLSDNVKPLANTKKGAGNNSKDNHEGAIYKNVIGTYLHGSILPKNPKITDWIIKKALEKKFKESIKLEPLDDTYIEKARKAAISRPR